MALQLICSPIAGIIDSNVYAFFVDKTGFAANVGSVTVPFFKEVCLFGALNGALEGSMSTLSEKVKRDWMHDRPHLKTGVDLFQIALTLISRYAIAIGCNEAFNTNISTHYIHLLNGLDALAYSSSNSKINFFAQGFFTALFAKCISFAVASPIFKNAFYFGSVNYALYCALQTTAVPKAYSLIKKPLGIENPRTLFINRLSLTILSGVLSYYATQSLFSKYTEISISPSYLIASTLFSLPFFFTWSITQHIIYDFLFDIDFPDVGREIARRKPEAQKLADLFQELFADRDNIHINRQAIQQQIQQGLLNEEGAALWNAFPAFRSLTNNIYALWKQGTSPQNIFIEILSSQISSDVIDPVVKALRKIVTPDRLLNDGASLITQEVLRDASPETLDAFRTKTRDAKKFVKVKALCIYLVGDKKEADLPYFFGLEAIKQLRQLRQELSENPLSQKAYEEILQNLNAATLSSSADAPLVPAGQNDALDNLVRIADTPYQNFFNETCYDQAIAQL